MPEYFCISVRFPDRRFHGRRDQDEPEWPPSPLRLFQALTTSAARMNGGQLDDSACAALRWLEGQQPPIIVAPRSEKSAGYVLSVPNNALDIPARAWSSGKEKLGKDADPATHRTMKRVQPMVMADGHCLRYLWEFPRNPTDELRMHVERLTGFARHIAALGWGIDLAVGDAAIFAESEKTALDGERWRPGLVRQGEGLRVPLAGTLDALVECHRQFLDRIQPEGFAPPSPLTRYVMVGYRRASDPVRYPFAAFSLLKPDASGFQAFDLTRRGLTVAGMLRHATREAAERAGHPEKWINTFVLGHRETPHHEHQPVGPMRYAYLPIPSLEYRGGESSGTIGSIRRAILTCFDENGQEDIAWVGRALAGSALIDEDNKEERSILSLLPRNDRMIRRYTDPAADWSTVTPVVLPGYDDPDHYRRRIETGVSVDEQKRLLVKLEERIDGLLRKAVMQAGYPEELARFARLDWNHVGFRPGAEHVSRYGVPKHLKRFPLYHVRVAFRDSQGRSLEIPGPLCLGGGRFAGLGLFAHDIERTL